MWALVACQLLFAAIIAFGPTVDQTNRVAGLVSLALTMVTSSAVASISKNRELKLGVLAFVTVTLAVVALRYTDGQNLRGPLAALAANVMATDYDTRLFSPHVIGLAVGSPVLFLTSLLFHPDRPSWLRGVWLIGALTGGALVVLSDSRAAGLALVGGLVVLAVSAAKIRRSVMLFGFILFVVAGGLATVLLAGVDPNLRQRGEAWSLALRAISGTPGLGLGYGSLSGIYRNEVPAFITNSHNLFIQTAADFGAIGLAAVLLATLFSIRAAALTTSVSRPVVRGFAACLAFIGVAGMVESIVDMTQRFPLGDVTIVVPLLFTVLAIPLESRMVRVQHPNPRHESLPRVMERCAMARRGL